MLTRKLVCPSCGVKLKVAETLPPGKVIACPKCRHKFAVPAEELEAEVVAEVVAEPERRRSKPAPLPEDDEPAERPRPARRKRKKRPQKPASNNRLLLVGLIGGIVALVGVGVAAVMLLWPLPKQGAVAAAGNPTPAAPSDGQPSPRRRTKRRPSPGPAASVPSPSNGSAVSAGEAVFRSNCARCHGMPGSGRRGRGPDLSHTGGVAGHTADWLTAFARDPKAVKPGCACWRLETGSRMPSCRLSENTWPV